MTKLTKQSKSENCKVHVMPPKITDQDISILLNGVIGVVRKKFELDTQAEFINLNANMNKLNKQLKEKIAECNRLKNEILFLKTKLKENEINN